MKSDLELTITPLGAAIVEAMPDRAKTRKINREFKNKRLCPTSSLFPTARLVKDYYVKKGMVVIGK